ncbi:hypothetical protein BO94DRAFT_294847 [Aspergillus sclerotioniger CBS 115572]|uniref:Uncharacterized protein n=1 Tax=Aspergillus sclerotioniger CBS 115572 TaxID=1450535 RepID=A0A317V5R4_9EURO|nr:hypothetical protein BO94DRAFT_294847 [Aspergillus sclerotioniger CBS 115572]PWY69654.1 hypothetical protein BO94DRAFT_294847 [Aspergillus sclerotioniger CBS 115572]
MNAASRPRSNDYHSSIPHHRARISQHSKLDKSTVGLIVLIRPVSRDSRSSRLPHQVLHQCQLYILGVVHQFGNIPSTDNLVVYNLTSSSLQVIIVTMSGSQASSSYPTHGYFHTFNDHNASISSADGNSMLASHGTETYSGLMGGPSPMQAPCDLTTVFYNSNSIPQYRGAYFCEGPGASYVTSLDYRSLVEAQSMQHQQLPTASGFVNNIATPPSSRRRANDIVAGTR